MPSDRILTVNIEDEMRRSYLDYAMSVIVARALPDVRDGLKPVHRRILYAMSQLGLNPDKQHRKCAGTVGEVLKNYHPHGDVSVYDALVRMAQDFSLRYRLVDGHGNFGSVDGDPPAAMRYTECRLHPLAQELLAELRDQTVDFRPNYAATVDEPDQVRRGVGPRPPHPDDDRSHRERVDQGVQERGAGQAAERGLR